ncbi:MAG TPA: sulfatase [Bryobacteraceae bacterium]|nr:sulfatase [Bryobacteraceae bacterium]
MSVNLSRRDLFRNTTAAALAVSAQAQSASQHRNIIFILSDDHRYDAMGFLHPQPWLRTPNLDSLAHDGVHLRNAFVGTALCSPSRASILTGVYAHRHRIVDNNTPIPAGTRFFPQLMQPAGYKTGFFGKWHMGNAGDDPQPGFDKWVSFRGQGTYLPSTNGLNVDGKHVPQKGYITDELTDYALSWLETIPKEQPYFLYLSHKAVHADFVPAERHKGMYAKERFIPPKTMAKPSPQDHRPMWVQNQRNSWHGVDFPYHSNLDIGKYYKRYAETLMGIDDSVGRVLDALRKRGQLDSTLVIYMGDNGFQFGEHGLIDKRTAYEESMRVPMLARCPDLFAGGRTVSKVVAGLDIMPTCLDIAGVSIPPGLDGRSMIPLLQGKEDPQWRSEFLYEYYWERNFPQTPTMHALRTDRYKYIHYYGLWDLDELYDLQEDPQETTNLILNPERKQTIQQLNKRLFDIMESSGAMQIPLYRDVGPQNNLRDPTKDRAADFPDELKAKPKTP